MKTDTEPYVSCVLTFRNLMLKQISSQSSDNAQILWSYQTQQGSRCSLPRGTPSVAGIITPAVNWSTATSARIVFLVSIYPFA